MRSYLRFSLRGLLFFTTVLIILLGWRVQHVRTTERAAQLLQEANVTFRPGRTDEPWLGITQLAPIEIKQLSIRRSDLGSPDLALAVQVLQGLNCVERVSFDGWAPEPHPNEFEAIAELTSITRITIDYSVSSAERLRPLTSLDQLELFSSEGSGGGISDEALEFLHTLPSLKEIGLPAGEAGVPEELRRPDVEYGVTDFPP